MDNAHFQKELFNHIRNSLPGHISLVEEIAELLQLSYDSVYRRVRGEKPLALHELKLICEKYRLSLDQLLQLETDSVLFDAPGMKTSNGDFLHHLQGILQQFHYFNTFDEREIYYLCKDSTIWNFYLFPEIAAFKTFFWNKTINNQPSLAGKSFSLEAFPYSECFALGQEVLRAFNRIPCIELWNFESMNSSINQIAYYRDAGHFKTREDFNKVVNSFLQMVDHLQLQAETGAKFLPGDGPSAARTSIQYYVNELILGNNTMVINLNGQSLSMVSYSVFHYLFTRDPRFSEKVMESFNTLLSRSTLISKTGEKDRNRYFNSVREKIRALG
ncbi:helix-turn-helix domain-containing protein [Flavihumibacter petaseus]|uniref:Transcription regulator BetR N-terminal domain-containing protein n=1 Tax=Flavihumibacter petaseus NBRC 106054 TaxID=1220578 RepID=A0A0E9N1C3_9BACT|nr:helix-turn-helix domain-containing protein [Flavihumibacter petaseus]GAO43548.1 hypothetical protein FPE01S_02_06530 [Flavihumibacter petaseus NBRC 106054]